MRSKVRFGVPARRTAFTALICLVGTTTVGAEPPGPPSPAVPIVVSSESAPLERLAAAEAAELLGPVYAPTKFAVADRLPEQGPAVLLGTPKSHPEIARHVGAGELSAPGSFVVKHVEQDGRPLGIIAGSDPRATLDAVRALAERHGWGFYISYDGTAAVAPRPFGFDGWDLADAPVFPERIVFNWHNFLSSCSTWDLPQWQQWIRQAAKMRYSAVMVHAYGNNPMVCFTHNGQTKPVGYLSTTVKGRDWGTQHVNDVRRLVGAEGIFDGPVFGCRAAMVPDDQRADAAKALMKQVVAYAEEQGVDVVFALDVDTASANPPNVIETLPESVRFTSRGRPLANPDTPEGYAYYQTQVETLLGDYPQIDKLVVWFRQGRTLWRDLKPADFPAAWKPEYEAALAEHPEIAKDPAAPSMFAINKIVLAFRKILDGMGRREVKLGVGSWQYEFMAAADALMPREVAFLPLDWEIRFEQPQVQTELARVGSNRPLLPIVWAHHDDHTYIGRPYTPPANFAGQLESCRAGGFGIIHWTTRPLDLYFKSLAEQTWQRTRDLPLEATCEQMAARTFGPELREPMGEYLLKFVTEGPQFGRETTDRFIDRPLDDPEGTIARARERLELLERLEVPRPEAAEHLEYFKLLEQFFIAFYESETELQRSIDLLRRGDLEGSREAMSQCAPEDAIRLYARAANRGRITRGEEALIISMNLRWLPYFEAQRQTLGLRAVRFNFEPTQHDPLAQGAGHRTFFVDPKGRLWLGWGEKETGLTTYGPNPRKVPPPTESEQQVCLTCVGSDQPIRLRLRNVTGGSLARGTHRVDVLLADNLVANPARPVFDLVLRGCGQDDAVTDRIDFAQHIRLPSPTVELSYEVRIDQGHLDLELTPVEGNVPLGGVVIECTRAEAPEPVIRKRAADELEAAAVTASGSVSGAYPPQKAADLDLRTRWAVEGKDHWLQLDLGAVKTVSRAAIAWFSGNRRRAVYAVETSVDAEKWTRVFDGQSSGNTLGLEPVEFDAAKARYVRIVCRGNSENEWNSITEVAVYGE